MTLFSATGNGSTRAKGAALAALLLTVLLWGAIPAPAATLADLAGPLRDLALSDSAMAARVAGVRGGQVEVEVLFRSPADATAAPLEALGAKVHARRDSRVQAIVPVSRLRDIALLPSVAQVRLPSHAILLQGIGPNVSEGVQLTNALSLQFAGVTGLGVSVAVIDGGFLDYATAELPPNVTVRSFRSDGLTDVTAHGTACAEVLADMAPACDMNLLAVDSMVDTENALEWCLANGVQLVSISLGYIDGPFDGLSRLDMTLDRMRASGILVVVAAGNFAQQHWAGEYVDADGNGFAEFDTADEVLTLPNVPAGAMVWVQLSWYETAGPTGGRSETTNRDYDLILIDSTGQQIARSAITQDGDDPPTEPLRAIVPAAANYSVKIMAVSSNIASGPTDKFQLFSAYYAVEPTLQIPETSLSMPAEARGALTVAATRGVYPLALPPIIDYPVDTLEPFSSQGPTVDGRTKPDMAGPDGVTTSIGARDPANPYNPFFGTSAATPHVAGGAALLLSESGSRTPDQLQTVLMQLAAAQNEMTPITLIDNTEATPVEAGVGRLSLRAGLDTEPPTVSISFPMNGTTITTARPTIIGVATDSHTGVDAATISLTLDGVHVQYDSYNPSTGVVTYTPPSDLGRTAHTVTLQASDVAGNQSQAAVSNFRVGLPTLSAGLHLFALPYANLLDPSPATIFGVPLNEMGLVRWVPTDTSYLKYRIYPDPLASFDHPDPVGAAPTVPSPPAGLGYFVRLPRQVVLNVQGSTLAGVPSYTVQLPLGTVDPLGWSMIGNPYTDTIDWATVQFTTNSVRQDLDQAIASGVTEGILFSWVPDSGTVQGHYEFVSPMSAVMRPMEGYWIHVLKSTAVTIYSATMSEAAAAAKTAAAKGPQPTLDNWTLHLVASGPRMLDTANYLGVAPNASTGHDIGADVPEPPVLGTGLSLYFPHSDWGSASGHYAQDTQARGAGTKTWAFEVACPVRNTDITLSWPELNASVPEGLTLRLEDVDNGRSVYMRTVPSYTYNTGTASVRHLRAVVEPERGGGLRIVALNAAPVRGGHVVITYQLSGAASVSAEIVNIAGRPVRALVSGREAGSGRNTLAWDGRNSTGVRVPAGTYLLHLTARSADGEAAKRVCPVNLGR